MPTTLARLLASPPALRSQVIRFALSKRDIKKFPALDRGLAHYSLQPPEPRPRLQKSILTQRFQTTDASPTSTTLPDSSNSSLSEPAQPSRTRRFFLTTTVVLIFFTTGFAMSAAPAAETVNGYLNPPNDAETLTLFEPPNPSAQEIDSHILNHPLSQHLRSQSSKWTESRPHMRIPPAMRPLNLTAGTLMGEDKIAVPPLNFNDNTSPLPSMVQIMHLGRALCGHPEIVHGGLLATMLDEGLARACFPALPNKVGVTASLKIDYRVPCPAGRYVVLKAETTKVEGRKAWVKGWIELLGEEEGEGVKLVEAEALFIEPKNASGMARNIVSSGEK